MRIRRFAAIVAFLLAGHAVLASLYWALLNVPESNVPMLALSGLLVIVILILAGWIESAATLGWMSDERPAPIARRAVHGIPAFLVALGIFTLIWLLTRSALTWHARHSGEIDALLMSRFGWTRTSRTHLAYTWSVWFVRWVVGSVLALGLVSAGAALGSRAMLTVVWVERAFSLRRLAIVGLLLLVCVVLPWRLVAWRPRVLPPTSVEVLFVTIKLGFVLIVAHIGWALMLRTASR